MTSVESVLVSESAERDIREFVGVDPLSWPTKTNLFSSNVQAILSRWHRVHVGFFKSHPFFLALQLTHPRVVRTPCMAYSWMESL